MLAYIIRRLLLIVPTLFGIMVINFLLVQTAPGGPVEQTLARLSLDSFTLDATSRFSGSASDIREGGDSFYRGAEGLLAEYIEELEVLYGFDKPPVQRFGHMIRSYLLFDFGDSFYKGRSVLQLIWEALPVSISLGLWSTLLIYFISIPMGIRKAVQSGSPFDFWTSMFVIISYAIPGFLFAVLLIVLFAGGSFWQLFPLSGLVSGDFSDLSWWGKIGDYLWHIFLPTISLAIGGFATLTMLTKNSFLEEVNKQYVFTARAKGLNERQVLYGHVFRNAMLIIIAGMPGVLIGILFTGALLVEIIFSLNGLGFLGFEAVVHRDYPIIFASLYIFTLLGLVIKIISDITYTLIDPRIDFESRGA